MKQTFQSLHASAPLRFDDAACRTLRGPYGGCRACAQACPSGAITVADDEVALKDGCLCCGRCMAGCPTGALRVDGFDVAWAPTEPQPLRIDCWKVPANAAAAGLRVPCLGGLSAGRLIEWWNAAGPRGLFLMERGWCRLCSAGRGEEHAATRALAQAQQWLIAAGVPRERLPRLVREPIPVKRMPAAIPDAALQRPVSRRNFFRTALAQAADAAQPPKPRAPAFVPYRSGASAERGRLLDGVAAAARKSGGKQPIALFVDITLDESCAGHGICARLCPTGALSLRANAADEGRVLVFDAAACIACGCCAQACPERALRIEAAKTVPAGPVELKHWLSRECEHCGDVFEGEVEAALCPPCRKSHGLAKDAFGALYRAPA